MNKNHKPFDRNKHVFKCKNQNHKNEANLLHSSLTNSKFHCHRKLFRILVYEGNIFLSYTTAIVDLTKMNLVNT